MLKVGVECLEPKNVILCKNGDPGYHCAHGDHK